MLAWALLPVAVFSFGWALMVPVVTLLALDQAPDRRGMASSVQACVGSLANALVAGVVMAPLVMHGLLGQVAAELEPSRGQVGCRRRR
jgi:DHA1 family bicyclomycin/chloramphenicol resistance-like MFS transporter